MLRHSAAGENSECVVFGQAVFQASHSLVPANTACYAGYVFTDLATFEVQKDNFQFSFEAAMDKKPLVCDNNLSLN